MCFFAHQLTRTKRFRTLCVGAFESNRNQRLSIDASEAWWLISYIFGVNIGCSLYAERHTQHVTILATQGNDLLIISGQPVVNLYANPNPGKPPEFGDFYTPLCPTVGLAICDRPLFPTGVHRLGPDEVRSLNVAQARSSQLVISEIGSRSSRRWIP